MTKFIDRSGNIKYGNTLTVGNNLVLGENTEGIVTLDCPMVFNLANYCFLDGVRDDTPGLLQAIKDAQRVNLGGNSIGGIVWHPGGFGHDLMINSGIQLPYGVRLMGAGARQSRIRTTGSFSTPMYMFQLGDNITATFSTAIEGIFMECGGDPNVIGGVFSSTAQDHCGVKNCIINNFKTYGIRFDGSQSVFGSVNAFELYDNEVYLNGGVTPGTGIGISIENGLFAGYMARLDTNGQPGVHLGTGLQLKNMSSAFLLNVTNEQCTDSIVIDTCGSVGIFQALGNFCDNTLHIKTGTTQVIAVSVFRTGGNNILVDDGSGNTPARTDTSTLMPLYFRGGQFAPANLATPTLDGLNIYGDRLSETRTALVDAATVTTNAQVGNYFTIALGGNRTMGIPSNLTDGQYLEYELLNNTGGAIVTTWTAAGAGSFALAGAWVDPATGKRRTIRFRYNSNFGKCVEIARAAADI